MSKSKPVLTEKICTDCGQVAIPLNQQRGSDEIEINLWLVMVGSAVLAVITWSLHMLIVHALHYYHLPTGAIARLFHRLTEIFFVAGLIYTVWRLSTAHQVCPTCQHENVIPLDSPRGRKVQAEHQKPSV